MLNDHDAKAALESFFFRSLPKDVFDEILRHSRVVVFDAGDILFRQGEPATAVYAVLTGLVKLKIDERDGNEVVVETIPAGTSFAEALVFQPTPYPVSAEALAASRVLVAPNKVVKRVLEENPKAFGPILASTYAHLHRLVRQIERLKSSTGAQRLAQYLLALSDQEDRQSFVLPMEKKTLASLLGMKPETLSRSIRRLEDHGVSVTGQTVRISDRAALQHVAGFND